MVALRLPRVLLILVLLGATLALVDEAVMWTGMPAYMSRAASGLAAGALVFLLAYRGGSVLRFAMYGRVNSPELSVAVTVALGRVGAAATTSRVVLFKSTKPTAVTVNDGAACCVFLSTGLVSGMSPQGLAGVLAHEYGHFIERHPSRQAVVLAMLAAVQMSVGVPAGAVLCVLLAYLMMLREWEYVADRQGTRLVGTETMLSALREYRGLSREKDASRWSELLCGHPSLHRRTAALSNPAAVI